LNAFLSRPDAELGERPPQVVSPPDRSAATEWFAAERANLTSSVRFAARAGRDRLAWRLAYAVWRYLFMVGYMDDCLALNELALVAADRAGEPHGVAVAHNNTAGVHYKRGRWDQALRHVDQAIAIRAELDRPLLLVTSLGNKAGLLQSMGDLPGALAVAQRAHEIYLACGPHEQPSGIPLAIGQIACWMGDYERAERLYLAMLDGREASQKDNFRSAVLSQLGELRLVRGRFVEAIELISEASSDWPLYMPLQFGLAISWLGAAHCAIGQLGEALRHLRAAVAIMVEHGEILGECEARSPYGTGLLASGDVSGAIEQYGLALEIAERFGFPTSRANALDGMADAYADIDPARSAGLRAQADASYRRLHMVRPVSVLAASLASQAHAAAAQAATADAAQAQAAQATA
jgi:tetratricopeptide (TPR) repeat protein